MEKQQAALVDVYAEEIDTAKAIQAGVGDYQGLRDAYGAPNPFIYPDVRRNESYVNTYLDTKVIDAYRWLENPDSEETQIFVDEQNSLAQYYLEKASSRDAIRAKLSELWDYKRTECPKKFGSRYFYLANIGMRNQSTLYVKDGLKDSTSRILVEPNELSVDGFLSVSTYSVSPNGDYIAYGLSEYGTDWVSIYIKNVPTGQNYLEVLNYSKLPTITWTSDNRGFFYQRYQRPKSGKMNGTDYSQNLNQKLYYHRIGTRQDDDILVAEFPDNPTWIMSCSLTLDGRYLLINAGDVINEHLTFYMDVGGRGPVVSKEFPLLTIFEETGDHKYLTNNENIFYFITNLVASNFHVVSFDILRAKAQDEWKVIVEESPTAVIVWGQAVAGDKLALCYNEHIDMRIQIHGMADGGLIKTVVFDDSISTWDYFGRRDLYEMFVRSDSYLHPGAVYRIKFDGETSVETEIYEKIGIPYFDPSNFKTELVFYSNDDGTNVPMTLIHKNSLFIDGTAPCILQVDGGFGRSLLPEFNPFFILFIQNMNGIVAIANTRGGGEYGSTWWEDGRGSRKPNVVDDYIAAANFLVNNKYTKPSKLTGYGFAHGATIIASALNRKPDVLSCAILDSGVMDILRFRNFTLGHLWITEYGNVDEEEELKQILSYSPLHNVKAPLNNSPQYPAILALAADHDDRVAPFHSYKLLAELQHTVGQTMNQTSPFLLRVYQNIGHRKGTPSSKAIEKDIDVLCFLENAMGYDSNF